MASAICSVQRIPERFHSIFDEVLAGAFDWAAGNWPTIGKVFVIRIRERLRWR
jgi:hypothetical protein